MRRRTAIQGLTLFVLLALSAHFFLGPPMPLPSPDWVDYEFASSRHPAHEHFDPSHVNPHFDDELPDVDLKEKEEKVVEKPRPAPASEEARALRPNRLKADVRKRDAVVKAFQHAWSAYEQDAFGADEYHPISHRGSNLTASTSTSPSGVRTSHGVGYTIIDALDTMLLIGAPLRPEYEKARAWVERELPRGWEGVGRVSTFETTIRTLGGLLSAYHLSQDPMFLERAAELGARLLPAFGASDDADSDSDSHSPDVDASASSSHVDAPASSSDVDDDEHTHAHAHAHGASWGAEAPAGSGSDGVVGSPDPVPSQRLRDSGIPSAEVWLGERDPPAAPDLSLSDVDAFVGGEAVYADSEPVRPKGGDPARPPSRGGMVRRALAGEGHASSDASSSDSVSPDNLTGQSQSQSETTTTTTTRPSRPRPPPAPKTKPRPKWPEREDTSIAEAATLQLEFRYLAHAVREWNDKNSTHQILPHGVQPEEFWYKAENVMRVLNRERLESGLAPHKINTTDGTFMRSSVRMGSSGDSYYEYLLKQYIQTNRTESVYLQMYTDAMRAVHEHMVQRTPWKAYTYITELVPVPGRDDWTGLFASLPKQDHLACFLAGSLMLGATRVHIQDPALAVVESSVPESDAPLDPLDPPPQVAQRPVSPIVDAAPPLIVDKVVSPMLDFDGQPPMPDVVDGQPNQRRAPVPQRPLTAAEAEEMGKNLQHLRASVPPRVRELSVEGRRDWDVGVALLEGCMDTTNTVTGLAPETVWWRADGQPAFAEDFDEFGRRQRDWYIMAPNKFWPPYDARYILRPEIAESVFLAWRLTGARHYRTYAWKIFKAIEMYCRLPEGGYATVMDVDNVPVKYDDKQETFFLSETLKYLYLTFADENVLDLNEVVFNTEAHPLPIFTPTIKPRFTEYSPLKPAPGTRYL